MNKQKLSPWLKGVIVSTVLVILPPLIGLVPTVIGMMRAFRAIRAGGGGDATELSQAISVALYSTAVGFLVAFAAAIALVICLVGLVMEQRKRNQAKQE